MQVGNTEWFQVHPKDVFGNPSYQALADLVNQSVVLWCKKSLADLGHHRFRNLSPGPTVADAANVINTLHQSLPDTWRY
jgi:hypothetical protein